jgi:hypothetical protein
MRTRFSLGQPTANLLGFGPILANGYNVPLK